MGENADATPSRDLGKVLQLVVLGNHHLLDQLPKLKGKLSVFISSTFADVSEERSILMYDILPALRAKGVKQEVDVTFVDMKFGIKDETTKDYDMWPIYKYEVTRCARESDGLFFLSLQSERCGYMPLPRYLPSELVDRARNKIKSKYTDNPNSDLNKGLDEAMALLEKWYRLDENAMPPHYVLEPWAGNALGTTEFWERAYPCLIELMKDDIFDTTRGPYAMGTNMLYLGHSATEWEVKTALDLNSRNCAHLYRQFVELHSDNPDIQKDLKVPREICDTHRNDKSRKLVVDLLEDLKKRLPPEQRVDLAPVSLKAYIQKKESGKGGEDINRYLKDFKVKAETLFNRSLSDVASKKDAWRTHLQSVGMEVPMMEEILHHLYIQSYKCSHFIGRKKLVAAGLDVLLGIRPAPVESLPYRSLTMAVVGPSGSGKTSFMSTLAERLRKADTTRAEVPVIIRYCGSSLKSRDGLNLLRTISWQIRFAYGMMSANNRETASTERETESLDHATSAAEYEAALKEFHSLLSSHPVILFIDGVDQLSNKFEERSKLSFLRNCAVHPDSIIVISCQPDIYDEANKKWIQNFGTDTFLSTLPIARVEVPMLAINDEDEVEALLLMMLERWGRKMLHDQWPTIWKAVQEEPSMIYLTVVANIVRRWKSYDEVENEVMGREGLTVQPTLKGAIDQFLTDLEKTYGKLLVRYIVGFITFSKSGVTDGEMMDLLSLSEEVMKEVFLTYKMKTIKRIPDHCWYRIRQELHSLLLESADGTLHWCHLHLREVIKERYTSDGGVTVIKPSRQDIHHVLGVYFSDLDPGHNRKMRFILPQPWLTYVPLGTFSRSPMRMQGNNSQEIDESEVFRAGSTVNIRRAVESFHQLVKANMFPEAIKELCDLNHICAWARTEQGFELLKDISIMNANISSFKTSSTASILSQQQSTQNKDSVANSVRRQSLAAGSGAQVAKYLGSQQPASVKSLEAMLQLFEHYCRWISHEMYSIMHNPFLQIVATGLKQPRVSLVRTEVETRSWPFGGKLNDWHCNRLGGMSQFSALISTVHAHEIDAIDISKDGDMIASASPDQTVKVWDSFTGQCLHTFVGHEGEVTTVCWVADGAMIVSGGVDCAVKFWDVVSGECVHSQREHIDRVSCLAATPDGAKAISSSWDSSLILWDVRGATILHKYVGHQGHVLTVSISLDGSKLISGGEDKRCIVWELNGGKIIQEHKSASAEVRSAILTVEDNLIFSAGKDIVKKGSTLGHHDGIVRSICKTIDGNTLLSGGDDNIIRVWNNQNKSLNTLTGHTGSVTSIRAAADGNRIISGSRDGTIRIWDASNLSIEDSNNDHLQPLTAIELFHDRSKLVTASLDGTVKIWDIATGDCTRTLTGHTAAITSIAVSSDGSKIVSGSEDCTVKVWIVSTGKCSHSFSEHKSAVMDLSIVGGKAEKAVSVDRVGGIRVWDVVRAKCLQSWEQTESSPSCVYFSADGNIIATGSVDGKVRIWSWSTPKLTLVWDAHMHVVSKIFLTPGAELALTWSTNQEAKVFDMRSGTCIQTFDSHGENIIKAIFSKDYARVAIFYPHSVKIYDVRTGNQIIAYLIHKAGANVATFSADGNLLATASVDRSITLWTRGGNMEFDEDFADSGGNSPAGPETWCV